MWARRCGAPPTWPSRVKVFLFSIGTGAIGFTIYTFMASSNLGYLDLASASNDPVLCLNEWPLHKDMAIWFDSGNWQSWVEYQTDMETYIKEHSQCVKPEWQATSTCRLTGVPLHLTMGSLGAPLEDMSSALPSRAWTSKDVLGIYAHLFLVLSVCLWLAISFHDHALLHSKNKDYILDVVGLGRDFPRFKEITGYVLGYKMIRRLLALRKSYPMALSLPVALAVPVLLVWKFLVFMFVVVPMAGVVFACYPIRTSRLWTFIICITLAVYGICLTVHMSYLLGAPLDRPRYAVTWQAGTCICGCVYPVSHTTCGRLLMIGVLAAIKASVLAFRTLKGLRRSNWANLMSVTFAVPVNAYSVEWKHPDGSCIKNREAGDPVQSELAFDPFALMDEQPESANMHVTLRPSSVLRKSVDSRGTQKWRRNTSRRLQGPSPSIPIGEDDEFNDVGCCGFPCRSGREVSIHVEPAGGAACSNELARIGTPSGDTPSHSSPTSTICYFSRGLSPAESSFSNKEPELPSPRTAQEFLRRAGDAESSTRARMASASDPGDASPTGGVPQSSCSTITPPSPPTPPGSLPLSFMAGGFTSPRVPMRLGGAQTCFLCALHARGSGRRLSFNLSQSCPCHSRSPRSPRVHFAPSFEKTSSLRSQLEPFVKTRSERGLLCPDEPLTLPKRAVSLPPATSLYRGCRSPDVADSFTGFHCRRSSDPEVGTSDFGGEATAAVSPLPGFHPAARGGPDLV